MFYILDEDEDEGEEIGEKEGQYFVDQATGQYYFQTTDGETMTVVSAPGIEEQGYLINVLVFISCANLISIEDEVTNK